MLVAATGDHDPRKRVTHAGASHHTSMRPASFRCQPTTCTRLRWLYVAFLCACAVHLHGQTVEAHIPELHGTTLAGQAVDLPAALQGKAGVLVVGFSRDSRAEATRWGKRLATDFARSSDVLYFELPVLEDVPRVLRSFVLRAIAREVSPVGQAHFLPVTTDAAQWKSVVHFQDPDVAYVLVVDSEGAVQWQVAGDATDEHYTALRRAVARLLAPHTTSGHASP